MICSFLKGGYILFNVVLTILILLSKDASANNRKVILMKMENDAMVAAVNPNPADDPLSTFGNVKDVLDKRRNPVVYDDIIPVSSMDGDSLTDEDDDVEMGQRVTASIEDILAM